MILRLRARVAGPSLAVTLTLTPRHRASTAMVFVACCYEWWFCDRRTVVALEFSHAAWTSKTPFVRFMLTRQARRPLDTCSAITWSRIFACDLVGVRVLGLGG